MRQAVAHPVASVFELLEILMHIRVRDRAGKRVPDQILLTDIGDVITLVAFGEQVVERLVAIGPDLFGNGLIPFFAIGEDRIDIEDDTAKIESFVTHDIANREVCAQSTRGL